MKCKVKHFDRIGIVVLFQELNSFFKFLIIICCSILLLPIIIFIRLLRPFVLIRFGTLISSRIGHYTGQTEMYLSERDAGVQPKYTIDIFFNEKVICNYQLKKMWDRILRVCQITRLQRPLYLANRLLPGYKKHVIVLPSELDFNGFLKRIPAHLSFLPEEEKKGFKSLKKMGIPAESKFICFMVRDSSYLKTLNPKNDWSYHGYRNSNIDNFIPMLEELARKGYYIFRMGATSEKRLNIDNRNVIDYSNNFRTEFSDIYLSAKCHFFVSTGTGIDSVAYIFRRPIVFVNIANLSSSCFWGSGDLFIPKKLWIRKERRFMTFREILISGIDKFGRKEKFEQMGIELIENTSEAITSVVLEMDERLKGSFQASEEDEELQQRFCSIMKSYGHLGAISTGRHSHSIMKSDRYLRVINTRIGSDFLRQNKDLLE